MAELTYRDAVIRGIAQEMSWDPDVVFLGEDVAKAGGVFKATVGLYEQFGPLRVRDTPISEQAILGAAMGAAMTGLKPTQRVRDAFRFCVFAAKQGGYVNRFPRRIAIHVQTPIPNGAPKLRIRRRDDGGIVAECVQRSRYFEPAITAQQRIYLFENQPRVRAGYAGGQIQDLCFNFA